jgi:diacylglycerol kinase family enzyme
MSQVDWPVKSAEAALLKWNDDDDASTCKLVYDAEDRYLRIVHAASSTTTSTVEIYDTIDVDDMIGADIRIEFTAGTSSSRSDAGNSIRAMTPSASLETSNNNNEPQADSVAVDTQAVAKLSLYVYPRRDPATVSLWNRCRLSSYQPPPTPAYERPTDFSHHGARYVHHRVLTFAPAEDLHHARQLVAALQHISRRCVSKTTTRMPSPPPHYLLIVNPRSGPKRNAVTIAETLVIPVLAQAGVETTLCVTNHPGHAVERCYKKEGTGSDDELDIAAYDGLVVMGGDGTMHEVINGIYSRPDAAELLHKVSIGIIGCGTANGLSTSIAHAAGETYGVLTDTFAIAKGQTVTADLSTYTVLSAPAADSNSAVIKQYTSFLTFTWGIIADIDIESEKIHWMGHSRFDVWAVVRVLALRKYRARFSYTTDITSPMPAITDPVPTHWTTIDDDIALFWASQVTHVSR